MAPKGFIFDLDGTVYLGDHMIEGASEAIRTIRERGDQVLFLSNKPIASRRSYAYKLSKMGIEAELSDIINSSLLVAKYLKKVLNKGDRVLLIGEESIRDELREHDIPLTEQADGVTHIVLSWDRQFTYDKLNLIFQAALKGAVILASNPDRTCPTDTGELPDTGALMGAVEGALGRKIDLVVGKPSGIAAQLAVEQLGLPPEDCYVVGDRLETDIRMGNENGMNSILVLTGITSKDMLARTSDQPKFILESIREIVHI